MSGRRSHLWSITRSDGSRSDLVARLVPSGSVKGALQKWIERLLRLDGGSSSHRRYYGGEGAFKLLDGAEGAIRALAVFDSFASQKVMNLNLWHKLEVCDGSSDFITCRF